MLRRFHILIALPAFIAALGLIIAPTPAAAQDDAPATVTQDSQNPDSDNLTTAPDDGNLAVPHDILPSRSYLIPPDRDLPHTNKHPWTRPRETRGATRPTASDGAVQP